MHYSQKDINMNRRHFLASFEDMKGAVWDFFLGGEGGVEGENSSRPIKNIYKISGTHLAFFKTLNTSIQLLFLLPFVSELWLYFSGLEISSAS